MPGRFTEGEIEDVLESEEMVDEEALAEVVTDDGVSAPPPPLAAD